MEPVYVGYSGGLDSTVLISAVAIAARLEHFSKKIVSLIIDLAHKFGLSVVAEGAEDPATLAALQKLHCDKVQGYVIAKPMPADEFENWLKQYSPPV